MRGVAGSVKGLYCCKCGEIDPEKFYPSVRSRKTGVWCKPCTRSYYNEKTPEGISRKSAHQRRRRERFRDALLEYKTSRGCADCGNKHPAVLDFHHRDEGSKSFNLGEQSKHRTSTLLIEAAKCDVLCSNCHRIRHWTEKSGHYQRRRKAEQ